MEASNFLIVVLCLVIVFLLNRLGYWKRRAKLLEYDVINLRNQLIILNSWNIVLKRKRYGSR